MKTFNVVYKKQSNQYAELLFAKVQADSYDSAIKQVNEMDSDNIAFAVVPSSTITLIKKYTKLYNKIENKSNGDVYVFENIDNFLDEFSLPDSFIEIFSTQVVCDNLTSTGIYVADDKLHIELYEMSDYTLLQLVKWFDKIVNVYLKGVKLDKLGK